ncbi:MAG: hypothetical protein ACRELY_01850 [Polyangiaceae bacterium]
MGFRVSWLLATVAIAPFAAHVAFAQDVGKPADTTAPATTATAPSAPTAESAGGASTDSTTTTAPTASAAPTSTSAPTMGYAYGDGSHHAKDGSAPRAHARARLRHVAGPIATLPGFLLLPEGGSRLFVELTQNVRVEEKPMAGGITYVLKGAHVVKRNNENALVTVHFNTPVTRARLIPRGGDLHFVVELRQNVKPTWKLVPAKDGAAVLQIDFPGGNFLPNDEASLNTRDTPARSAGADAAKAPDASAKKSDAKK